MAKDVGRRQKTLKFEVVGGDIPLLVVKSKLHFWAIEHNGLKPNTVRIVSSDEEKQLKQIQQNNCLVQHKDTPNAQIKVINVETNEYFERVILSIEKIGEIAGHSIWLISWLHK